HRRVEPARVPIVELLVGAQDRVDHGNYERQDHEEPETARPIDRWAADTEYHAQERDGSHHQPYRDLRGTLAAANAPAGHVVASVGGDRRVRRPAVDHKREEQ